MQEALCWLFFGWSVRWCNGSTRLFGGLCHGSNPCRTANFKVLKHFHPSLFSQAALCSCSWDVALRRRLLTSNGPKLPSNRALNLLLSLSCLSPSSQRSGSTSCPANGCRPSCNPVLELKLPIRSMIAPLPDATQTVAKPKRGGVIRISGVLTRKASEPLLPLMAHRLLEN